MWTFHQELSRALCLGNDRMYDRPPISVACGVGRGLMAGLKRALDEAGDV